MSPVAAAAGEPARTGGEQTACPASSGSSLELQEDRLAFALKADVETVRAGALRRRDQRARRAGVQRGEQRVGGERGVVAGQVDAGEQVVRAGRARKRTR